MLVTLYNVCTDVIADCRGLFRQLLETDERHLTVFTAVHHQSGPSMQIAD